MAWWLWLCDDWRLAAWLAGSLQGSETTPASHPEARCRRRLPPPPPRRQPPLHVAAAAQPVSLPRGPAACAVREPSGNTGGGGVQAAVRAVRVQAGNPGMRYSSRCRFVLHSQSLQHRCMPFPAHPHTHSPHAPSRLTYMSINASSHRSPTLTTHVCTHPCTSACRASCGTSTPLTSGGWSWARCVLGVGSGGVRVVAGGGWWCGW